MPGPPSRPRGDGEERLELCIRDLAALNALPSLCVGRTPDEALDILLDALPTALDCDLIYLTLPGSTAGEQGRLRRAPMTEAELAEIRLVMASDADGADAQVFLAGGKLWCLEAEIPLGAERGRLLAGRSKPLDVETDRVLIRTAANIVGTTLQTAIVLETARRKDDFLAMLGHELRNPLAPILTAVELLQRQPAVARERNVIERHTRHLARLVDDLLDISRVTRGQVQLQSEQVSLAAVLERAVEIASPQLSRARHELQVGDANGVTVEGDPVRLAQIFSNLLTNAAKFTPPEGKIDVLIDRVPALVRVTVRDNGIGIAPDQTGRIFEPFVQADRERDALRGGLGLGLAIVKNLVERHRGTITVHSEGRGRGASFVVELPTVVRVDKVEPKTPIHGSLARAGVRVLVVDDNVDVANLLAEALQEEGFRTAVAYDGTSALQAWRGFSPQAAILDVGLPDIDGYDLARGLRLEHGRDAVLIAATGYGQPEDRLRSAEAGFDCHLTKPVSLNDLLMVLDERVVSARTTDTPRPEKRGS